MAKESKVSVPLTVELRDTTYKTLTDNIQGGEYVTSSTLSNRATKFFEQLVDGGMLLTADQVRKMEEFLGKTIRNGVDVVNAATKSVGVEDGQFIVKITVDQSFIEPLRIRAEESSCTLDELMSRVTQYGLEQNWVYNVQPESGPLWLDNKDLAYVQKLTGKERPTGTEIIAVVREALKQEKAA